MDPYDALPYDRLSVRETHPDRLAALARLYGVESTDPRRCRMLELGCAAGANLIPMAWFLPDSRFLGLDLSEVQVRAGQALITELGLRNAEIQRGDVGGVDLGDAGFDYIVAHGLYSWIPAALRPALLRLIRRHLNTGGVAYLSFNALPGWHMRGMLREMLLYHVRALATPVQRVAAAREFLQFLGTGLAGLGALSADYLREELVRLERAPDGYLYHEFLAAVNDPQLFSDFVAAAGQAGLRYLCNAELRYQFPSALGEGAEQAVGSIADRLARQQYLDFLLNRNFHQAVLVRDDTVADIEPDYDRFAHLALYADLAPPNRLDLRKARPQPFTDAGGERHAVSHPLCKAAVTHLAARYPQAVAYAELEAIAQQQVAAAGDARLAGQVEHLFGELFQLFVYGALSASTQAGGAISEPVEPPRATALARAESAWGRLVDSRHATLTLDRASVQVIRALDGTHGRDQLAGLLRSAGATPRGSDSQAWLRTLTRHGALVTRACGDHAGAR